VSLLGLPPETIQRIESEAMSRTNGGLVESLTQQIKQFMSKD
jgi:hypothetical protein